MEWTAIFLDPLSYEFMQRGLIAAILVGSVCAVLSCYMVLKGWSLMGDAISHAVLPGIVLSFVTGLPFALGAFAAGMICAVGTGYIKENSRVREDTVMGIVFSGMFATGLVLLTKIETDIHLLHILFGNMLGVSWRDVFEISIISAITLFCISLKWRDFMLYCFDPLFAKLSGLSVRKLHFGLLILLSMTIVASIKAVGVILVTAMLIAPGATGFLLAKTFGRMMMIALFVSIFSSIAGTLISFHADMASGPCIVVFQIVVFILAAIYTGTKNRGRIFSDALQQQG